MWGRERRLAVLAAILLLVLGYLLFGPDSHFYYRWTAILPTTHKTLSGKNEVLSLTTGNVSQYKSVLEIEFFYNGSTGPHARLQVDIPLAADASGSAPYITGYSPVSPGKNKIKVSAVRFGLVAPQKSQTQTVKVSIVSQKGEVLANREFEQTIDWPSSDPFSLASGKPAEIGRLYMLCVETIDAGRDLDNAKRGLEQILLANPDHVSAYAELARYQMKTNWSASGLLQAEQSLNTALRLDSNHANTLVLIGYVYANQRRFKEAEEALRKAERIGTKNIWLYSNWGDLRSLEGKRREAIEKYQKAVVAPADLKTYERARAYAYEHLLSMLIAEKRWSDADALHQQRVAKYPDNGCYKAEYAGFYLARHGDYENAIMLGGKALEQECHDSRIDARLNLAMAYYTKWAKLSGLSTNTRETDQFFSRGQTLYSDMPVVLYSLSRSPHTMTVIPALKRRGIGIDIPDRAGISALGHSILRQDIEAGHALIRQGANVNQRMSPDSLTPLMLAASRGDHVFVSILLKNGADRKLRTRTGYTAERIAAESGFKDVANQLAAPSGV